MMDEEDQRVMDEIDAIHKYGYEFVDRYYKRET